DFVHPKLSIHEEEAKYEESFDPIIQTSKNSDDEGNDDACLGMNVGGEEGQDDDEELYRDVNINLEGRDVQMTDVHTTQEFEDTHVTLTPVAVQIQSDRLRDEAQAENEEFLNKLDENIQRIIKDQFKEQVKVQVSKILSKIEKTVNEQLEAEVLTRLSNSSKTSYVVAADLSELELKKILIEKMESNNDLAKKADSRSSFNELMDTPSLVELEFFLEEVYKATTDQLDWNNPEGQQYPHNLLKPLPLIPNSRGRHVIPFDHFINNDLEYLRGGASSRKYTTSITKKKAANYGYIKWIEDLVPCTMGSQEPVSYDKYAHWEISHWGHKCQ
nr:hypothetical protein [Tanacetum cinerariifolium]